MSTQPIDVREAVSRREAKGFDTAQLRSNFLMPKVFAPGELTFTYLHYDRMCVIGAMPTAAPLSFGPQHADIVKCATFLERRELGILNVGGPGIVEVDGHVYDLAFQEALYVPAGTKSVQFMSADPAKPAKLYMNSAPAHCSHPVRKITKDEASPTTLGAPETANRRTIYKYFYPALLPTCQLVMGMTRLETGSVWNTMPCHVHDRRMEVYLYFELPQDAVVFHMMGTPEETRHLVVRNEQAIVSPPWSIHAGAATSNYAFVWSMAGDNQVFTDMDMVAMSTLA